MTAAHIHQLYLTHGRWVPMASFLLGFLFDVLMLSRIDELNVLIQQAVYLGVAALLVSVELVEEVREVQAPRFLKHIWKYREFFLHFLLGTLLNSYAIFYFKSASALTSFLFIGLLVGLLTLNEFKRFGKSQTQVHVAFLSLCLVSYLICLAPTILGFIGVVPFLCALSASVVAFAGFHALMRLKLSAQPRILQTHLTYPFAVIQIVFAMLYFFNLIPPVPLSVRYMGIYHGAERTEAGYELSYTRPAWKFWEHGDETFLARSGDTIYAYAQIFSPTRFKEKLQVRWLYRDDIRGWETSDAIPMPVTGGREEGFRALTMKNNFRPGTWRVQIETTDNQEIGRLGFEVVADNTSGTRASKTVIR
jgi:hypothetical protein